MSSVTLNATIIENFEFHLSRSVVDDYVSIHQHPPPFLPRCALMLNTRFSEQWCSFCVGDKDSRHPQSRILFIPRIEWQDHAGRWRRAGSVAVVSNTELAHLRQASPEAGTT